MGRGEEGVLWVLLLCIITIVDVVCVGDHFCLASVVGWRW